MKKHILVALTFGLATQAHAAGAGVRAGDMDPALLRALAMSQAAAEEEAEFQRILEMTTPHATDAAAGAGVAGGAPLGVIARVPAAVAADVSVVRAPHGAGEDIRPAATDSRTLVTTILNAQLAGGLMEDEIVGALNTLDEGNREFVARTVHTILGDHFDIRAHKLVIILDTMFKTLADHEFIGDFIKLAKGLSVDNIEQLVNLIQSHAATPAGRTVAHSLVHTLSSMDMNDIMPELRMELYCLLLLTPDQNEWIEVIKGFAARNGIDVTKLLIAETVEVPLSKDAIAATTAAVNHEIEGMDPILRRVLHTLLLDTPDQSQWGNVIKGFVDTNGLAVSSFFAEANDTATKAVVDALKRIAAEEAAAEAARLEALRETLAREHAAAVASHDAGVAAVPAAAGAGATWAPAHVAAATFDPATEDPRARAAVIAEATRRRLQATAATQAAIRAEAEARAVADAADAEREAEAEKAARIKAGLARLGK